MEVIEMQPSSQQPVNPPRDGSFISSIPYPKIFGYLIPTLAAVVGIVRAQAQGGIKSLMETHTVSLCVVLVALIVHYIAFAVDRVTRRNQANLSEFWGLIATTSGSLSAISVISILFPHSVAEIICYIALGCAAIIIIVYQYGRSLMDACRWIYHEILRPFFNNILNWFKADIHRREADIHPRAAATAENASAGNASAVSVISILFPHSVAEIICYVALGCAAAIIFLYEYGGSLMDACRWIYQKISGSFSEILQWFKGDEAAATADNASTQV